MTAPPPPAPDAWRQWDLHPSVIIGLALLGGLYVYLGGLRAPRRRVASFAGALLVLGLSLNGPLHNLSDRYLFSVHMVQHLVLTLVFPPLLLYGMPAWVLRPLLQPLWLYRLARWATGPLAAGVLFSVPITLWHFPQFYGAALEHHLLHIVQHPEEQDKIRTTGKRTASEFTWEEVIDNLVGKLGYLARKQSIVLA